VEIIGAPLKVQHAPTEDDLRRCHDLGEEMARQLRIKSKEVA